MKTVIVIALFIVHCRSETSSDSVGVNKIVSTKQIQNPEHIKSAPQYVLIGHRPAQAQPVLYSQRPVGQPVGHMVILAQQVPAHSYQPQVQHSNPQNSPQFQNAVQELLNYYENNPQARLQLLHQQHGPYFQLAPTGHQPAPQQFAVPASNHGQNAYIVQGHQSYPVPSASQQVAPQGYVIPSHQVPVQYSNQPIAHEGMRVIAAPQLDQAGQHYIPATPSSSGQHYIPAFANGQFSVGPGSYQTIPQQYYQGATQQSTKVVKGQPKLNTNSRNDLNSNEKYQQSATTRSNYYYKV